MTQIHKHDCWKRFSNDGATSDSKSQPSSGLARLHKCILKKKQRKLFPGRHEILLDTFQFVFQSHKQQTDSSVLKARTSKVGGEPRQCLEKCIIPHSAASSFGVTLFHPQLRGPPTGCIDCRSHACSSSLSGLRAHVIDGTISSFVTFTFITAALADYFYGSVKADASRYGGTRGRKYVLYSVCSIIQQLVTLTDLCWEGKRFNHRCKKVEGSYSSVTRAVMAPSPWLEKHSFWFVNVEMKQYILPSG